MRGDRGGTSGEFPNGITDEQLLRIYTDPATPEGRRLRASVLLTERGVPRPELDFADDATEPELPVETEASQGIPRSDSLRPSYDGKPDYSLPHNLAGEINLLSRMAHDKAFRLKCIDALGPDDFFLKSHRVLFRAFLALHRADKSIDLANVLNEVSPEDRKHVGNELLQRVVEELSLSSGDGRGLIEMVVQDASVRRFVLANREIERKALARQLSSSEMATQGRAAIEALLAPGFAPGWEPPLLDGMVRPEPFPADVLPKSLVRLADWARDVMFVPPDYILTPCLAIAGAAMGRSVALALKDGYIEYGSLYTVIVGAPGTAKTPALKLVSSPVWKIFRELQLEHAIAREIHEGARRMYEAERRKPGGKPDLLPFSDPAPVLRRIAVSDTTVESLAVRLWENPKGLVMIHDELSSFLAAMNQYKPAGEGNDKHFYLQAFTSSPIPVDRKGQTDGPMFIAEPFLGIAGGIQPDILPAMDPGRGKRDGFIDRFLFSFPERMARDWSKASIPPKLREDWRKAVDKLWNREMLEKGGEVFPHVVHFEPAADEAHEAWYRGMCKDMVSPHFNADFEGAWSKFLTYGGRLALVLEQLHWAYDSRGGPGPRNVGVASVEGAAKLIEYYKNHFRRVYVTIRGVHNDNRLARDIVAWVAKSERRTIRESEARDNFKRSLQDQPRETLREALQWLVQRHVLRRAAPTVQGAGRKPLDLYEVNPLIFEKRPTNSEGV